MARTALTAVQASRAGTTLPAATAGDAINGNQIANDGRIILLIENTNGTTTDHTVTFSFSKTVDGQPVTARSETIPAGETQVFGPFSPTDYGDSLALNVDNAELTIQAVHV